MREERPTSKPKQSAPKSPASSQQENAGERVPQKKSVVKKKPPTNKTSTVKKAVRKTLSKTPSTAKQTAAQKETQGAVRPIANKAPSKTTVPKTPARNRTPETKKQDAAPPSKSLIFPPRKKGILRKRSARTDTISKIYYQIARKNAFKKNLIRSVFFIAPLLIFVFCILWMFNEQKQKDAIVKYAGAGLTALENNSKKEAAVYLQKALDIYSEYHTENPRLWWQRDTQIFTVMFGTLHGWRQLSDYRTAFRTVEQILLHNSEGMDSWVGRQIEEELIRLIDPAYWTPEQLQIMYKYLVDKDSASWGKSELSLIRATEWVGLYAFPMEERLQQSKMVVYGVPKGLIQQPPGAAVAEAVRYYYTDRLPGELTFFISPEFPANERKRLNWYFQSDRECLMFFNDAEQPVLRRLQDIVLSEKFSVKEFNRFYKEE